MTDRFIRACRRQPVDRTPVWFMRQAGRYMADYRALRERHSLLELCRTPELATRITLQPIDAIDVDAAIIFSDLLLPFEPMGLAFDFVKGEGPRVEQPLRTEADIERLRLFEPREGLGYVLEAIRMTRRELDGRVPLIGFAGAPFTLASYAIEGGPSRDFARTKALMYGHPEAWHRLCDRLAQVVSAFVVAQVEAGAEAIQIFDSWVGALSASDYREFASPHTAKVFAALKAVDVPTIHFGTGTSTILTDLAAAGGDVIGVDWRLPLDVAWEQLGATYAVQGNLDPTLLLGPRHRMLRAAEDVLQRAAGRPGHIFNLGHGILPASPLEHVQVLARFVHGFRPSLTRTPVAADAAPIAVDVAVVGGGLAGLTLARDVHRRGRTALVLEAGSRLGGVIRSELVDGVLVEGGPDAMLVQKPAALALCRELGLADEIVSTESPRTAFVLADGRLHAFPPDTRLGLPLTRAAAEGLTMLSADERARVSRDFDAPAPPAGTDDESVGAFTTRRFGEAFTRRIAQPLLGGIHAGDVDRLSLRALFPMLADADAAGGSVLGALAARAGAPDGEGAFRGLRGGMGQLPAALMRALPGTALRTREPVAWITPGQPFRVMAASGLEAGARAVVLAVPAAVAARLVAPFDATLAGACDELRTVSSATVTLGYPRDRVAHPCNGMGFIVPRGESTRLLAVSWVTSKWAGRAPRDWVVLRAFAGGAFDADVLEAGDDALVAQAHADLAPILGISGLPMFARLHRWNDASPQYEVGHLARVARIAKQQAMTPGLFLTGSAYRGVGMPDVIADARATADRVCQWLEGTARA